MRQLLVPLALLGLVFVWADPAGAYFISFVELSDGTGDVTVTTDLPNARVSRSAEIGAIVVDALASTLVAQTFTQTVNLTEPGIPLASGVSDKATLTVTPNPATGASQVVASFFSDSETLLPATGTNQIVETGLLQQVISATLGLAGGGTVNFTVNAQSDLTPVPEPSMGLLVSITGLIGMGGVLWRRHRRS